MEDDNDDNQQSTHITSSWIEEWKLYVNTYKVVPDDMGIVEWWGVSSQPCCAFLRPYHMQCTQANGGRYPVWQSLVCDYLAVMASLVSSERAFSSAGITICKRRNHLNSDIVEALQCLKSFIQQDLMVRNFITVAEEEAEMDYVDEQPNNQDKTTSEAVAWQDTMLRGDVSDGGEISGDDET
jgi:hypothetical protein